MPSNETSPLFHQQRPSFEQREDSRKKFIFHFVSVISVTILIFCITKTTNVRSSMINSSTYSVSRLGNAVAEKRMKMRHHHLANPPSPEIRCEWVIDQFAEKDGPDPNATLLKDTYLAQSVDFNVFYRATAHIFWKDFSNAWGNLPRLLLDQEIELPGKIPLTFKSTWTWVTGDQHLSNFGAWKNRNGEVVFGVNDFDEAAIYDFHIDVLRIAVSICNHALTNKFTSDDTSDVLRTFTHSYVDSVLEYIGNEKELLFELTPKTSYGKLQQFLKKVQKSNSASKQLKKFTDINETTGLRYFIKGKIGSPHNYTHLVALPSVLEDKIRAEFTSTRYGASMMKLGWNVHQWDDDYFTVLDVAGRVGSGIGSYGVSRFYVLLKGRDGLLDADNDGTAVILDVKYEPKSAVWRILSTNDAAWYNVMFSNPAQQAAEGQRHLTSYTDPFTGWILIPDDQGILLPYSVRQRSPWKTSFDLNSLTDLRDYLDFVAQVAQATATSHVRGSVAKAPAQFKHVIESIMSDKSIRNEWSYVVERIAKAYHQQVILDFNCFKDFVETKYS